MASPGRSFTPDQAALAQRICALNQGSDSYYDILEIDEKATDADIKRSFRLLALQLHPDKNGAPGAEEAFKLVAEAYEVLGNPQERAAYDNERQSGLSGFYTGSYGSYANNDDFEYEDPPPYRPRTPPPNETRKQKRQREFEDRKARQREKDQAERKARRQEKERRRRAKFRDVDDVLRFFAGMGMRFVFCEHCDRVHMHLDGEPVEHDPPSHRASSASQRTAARTSPVQPRAPQQAVFEEAPAQVPVPHEARNAPRPPSDPPAGFGRRPAQQPRFSGRNAAASSSSRSGASEERPATAPERHIATVMVIAALALVAYLGYKIIAFLLRRTWGRITFGCFAVLFLVLCCPALPAEASERAKAD